MLSNENYQSQDKMHRNMLEISKRGTQSPYNSNISQYLYLYVLKISTIFVTF